MPIALTVVTVTVRFVALQDTVYHTERTTGLLD